MYFDQLCSNTGPYTQYRTFSTTIVVTFTNTQTTPNLVGWYASPSGTLPVSQTQALEKPWGAWYWLSGTSGGQPNKTLSFKIDHAKAIGVTKKHLELDDYYAGAYNSSPTKGFFLVFYAFGSTAAASVYATIEMNTMSELFSLTNTGTS